MASRKLYVIRQGPRFKLCAADDRCEIWQTGRFRHRPLGSWPRHDAGFEDALARFNMLEPTSEELPPPGAAYEPRQLTRQGSALAAVTTLAVLILLGLIGAGLGSSSGQPRLSGWVYHDDSSVVFLQWTRSGSSIQGGYSSARMESGDATTVKTEAEALTGTVNGHSITVVIGGLTQWSGELHGSTLSLSVPDNSGAIQVVSLKHGSTADYNTALGQLQVVAQKNQQAADQASAAAAQSSAAAAAQASADQAVDEAINSLRTALQSANGDTGTLATDTAAISDNQGPLATEATDLATTQSDAAKVETEARSAPSGDASVCSDAASTQSDAASVDSDNASVQSALASLASDVQTMQEDQKGLTTAADKLRQAQQADSAYTPAIAPPAADQVTHTQATLAIALSKAAQATKTATDKGTALATAAHSAADQASSTAGC